MNLNEEVSIEEVEDILAEAGEFILDLFLVILEKVEVLGALGFLLLFDGGNGTPGSSAGTNGVLVGNGKKVTFFNSELLVSLDDVLHVIQHVFESLGLLGDLSQVD